MEPGSGPCLSRPLLGADVRHHRVLPPLSRPPELQDVALVPVPVRRGRQLQHPEGPAVVGRASSPPPPVFRRRRRRSLAHEARALVRSRGVDLRSRQFTDPYAAHPRPRQVPRAPCPQSLRRSHSHPPGGFLLRPRRAPRGDGAFTRHFGNADARLGFLHLDGGARSQHLHHQLPLPSHREAQVRDHRHQQEQPGSRVPDHG